MIGPLVLLVALLAVAGCRSERPPAPDAGTRYPSVAAALAAHPGLRTDGFYVVDGVPGADVALVDTLTPANVASVEVVQAPRCPRGTAETADGGRQGPAGCPVLLVTTRSGLRAAEQGRRRSGVLRLRVRDEATDRFVAAEYYAVADDASDVSVFSADGGWGTARIPAGVYRLVLFEYPCGDERYMPDEEFAERTALEGPRVTVRPGRRTDVDLRIDVRAIPADTVLHPPRCTP